MGLGTLQKRKWTTLCRAGCAGAPGPSSVALHGVIDLPDQLLEDVLEEDDADGDVLGALHPPQVGAGPLHGGEHVLNLVVGVHGHKRAGVPGRYRLAALSPGGVQDVLEVKVSYGSRALPLLRRHCFPAPLFSAGS